MGSKPVRRKLVSGYTIMGVEKNPLLPCRGIVAKFDNEIGDVIPTLFIKNVGHSSYVESENILTIKVHGRLMTFYPDGRVVVGSVWDENVVKALMDKILHQVNEAYEEMLREGPPTEEDIKRGMKLSWMDVYELLPKTNCGECGRETCLSFATDVMRGEAKLSECVPLKNMGEEASKRVVEKLGPRIAKALGWG